MKMDLKQRIYPAMHGFLLIFMMFLMKTNETNFGGK